MTETDLIARICECSAGEALRDLAAIPQAERRAHAGAVLALYKAVERHRFGGTKGGGPAVRDSEAVTVAVLATASLSELKRISPVLLPWTLDVAEVLGALRPDWIAPWAEGLIAANPALAGRLAPLWHEGLMPRPGSDAFIMGYYAPAHWGPEPEDDPVFLSHDVWRFFEIEGGGEFSLASHDKYANSESATWQARLLRLARTGALDRARLIDASLDALERGFGQFRAGWYARFHTALDPTPEERGARGARYLALMSSPTPTIVSFALKAVQRLEKAGALAAADLLPALETPLQARGKSTSLGALKLVAASARRDPVQSRVASHAAVLALGNEAAEVQSRALDLVEGLGAAEDPALRAALSEYAPFVVPSLRDRLAALAGTAPEGAEAAPAPAQAPAAPDCARPGPVCPVASPDEALALLLGVLETVRDPFEVERAMDGLARFGAELRGDATALSPLAKRARQVWANPGDSRIRAVCALTCLMLAGERSADDLRSAGSAVQSAQSGDGPPSAQVFLTRNAEILAAVEAGHCLPMLSAPTDTRGCVAPAELAARLRAWHAAGCAPGMTDLSLALLRLAPEGRDGALPEAEPPGEAERALAYACGRQCPPGETRALWAAAWAARQPAPADSAIAALFDPPLPDCGLPAETGPQVGREDSDGYHWIVVDAPVTPAETDDACGALPALFYPRRRYRMLNRSVCGWTYADVAWAGLIRPLWQAPFQRQALLELDPAQKLSDPFCAAYLEPFLRPGPPVEPLGAATLAYFLASEDRAVSGLAAEAIAALAEDGRLDPEGLAAQLAPFIASAALPTPRWTKAFAGIAERSDALAGFVRETLSDLLGRLPAEGLREMGGLVELLYELHVAARRAPDRPGTLRYLKSVTAGGKLGKASKKLLALAP